MLNEIALEQLHIPKNASAKLSLEIRKHQEKFISERIENQSYEKQLELIEEHLTSLYELEYEIRSRELQTAKLKDEILKQIESLHKSEYKRWDKENPEKLLSAIAQKEQREEKKSLNRFEKFVAQMRKLNFKDDWIADALKKMGCSNIPEAMKQA